ncbi:prepilin-type N-terminal cleavage/methylation domain-containing protein [Vibrio renipiscarius]|uniref:Methylation site containing protein n=1 Tax=Vibrio renipiscarius TaxID=1461322 RepID=A0A0C2NU54_9VIBR|nr:prepilin-type N-terminal cleavage/methylation domain-containing protein [Vibrio renipiscarius]KII79710.1 methylation site containing protein [Vibrio renipiscarius]KII80663.1 methylation site containing protein [Vibrio renipiscarius]
MNKNNQSGFTLIELVVVIVILAILAVVAFPRFINYEREAHLSTADSAFASFQSAVNLFHNKWLVEGEPSPEQSVDYGEGNIFPSEAGFPISVGKAANSKYPVTGENCAELWHALMDVDLTIRAYGASGDTGTILPSTADIATWYKGSGECTYHYTTGFDLDEKMPTMLYSPLTGEFTFKVQGNNSNNPA